MRRSTVILAAVFILLLTLAGLFWMGGTLSARLNVVTAGADSYPQAYQSVLNILNDGAAPQRFAEPLPDDPALSRLEDVTITLFNRGLVDAEWVSVSVEGAPGDVAVYSVSGEGSTISARSSGTVNLKLVAAASGTGARAYRVQYYVYGLKREIVARYEDDQT